MSAHTFVAAWRCRGCCAEAKTVSLELETTPAQLAADGTLAFPWSSDLTVAVRDGTAALRADRDARAAEHAKTCSPDRIVIVGLYEEAP